MMDLLPGNIRDALQDLFGRPRFSSAVMMMLAIAIGANTMIVTVMHAVLMNSYSVSRPGEPMPLADAAGPGTSIEYPQVNRWDIFSFPGYQDAHDQDSSQHLCVSRTGTLRLSKRKVTASSDRPATPAEAFRKHEVLTTKYQATKGTGYGQLHKRHPLCAS